MCNCVHLITFDCSTWLQACTNAKASLYGALCAAGLKAAAAAKQLGNRAEHYAIISLVDCRKFLEPSISDSTVGTLSLKYNSLIYLSRKGHFSLL